MHATKKYIVRLSDEEREICTQTIKKQSGTAQKVKRAQILLKADCNGPDWTDKKIAEAFDCRTKTVENVRQRLVQAGFDIALNGNRCPNPKRKRALDGEQEAALLAMRLSEPPAGYSNWSLRLLRNRMIELGVVGTISHETIRQTIKKKVHSTKN